MKIPSFPLRLRLMLPCVLLPFASLMVVCFGATFVSGALLMALGLPMDFYFLPGR